MTPSSATFGTDAGSGCGSTKSIKADPNGPSNTTSGKFRFFGDGYLINGKGHLHDGGVSMDLSINGKYVCSSNAIYGGEGNTVTKGNSTWETIAGMSICPGPIEIKDGELIKIQLPLSGIPQWHLFFSFRNRSSRERLNSRGGTDASEKPFAFAFLPLCLMC